MLEWTSKHNNTCPVCRNKIERFYTGLGICFEVPGPPEHFPGDGYYDADLEMFGGEWINEGDYVVRFVMPGFESSDRTYTDANGEIFDEMEPSQLTEDIIEMIMSDQESLLVIFANSGITEMEGILRCTPVVMERRGANFNQNAANVRNLDHLRERSIATGVLNNRVEEWDANFEESEAAKGLV